MAPRPGTSADAASYFEDEIVVSRPYIFGTGEMADRVRDFDWDATPLGDIHTWPTSCLRQ